MFSNTFKTTENQNKVFCYEDAPLVQPSAQVSAPCHQERLNKSMEKQQVQVPSNMVMIDQQQLLELLAAKQILDAQIAAATAQQKPVFNSALFIPPQKEDKTQSTSFSSSSYSDVEPLKSTQKPCISVSAMTTPEEKKPMEVQVDHTSEHSTEDQTQGQMLDDDLMRIIGDCTEQEESHVESFDLSKINTSKTSSQVLNKSGSSLDSFIQTFSKQEAPALQAPASQEYKSIFSSDPVWTAPEQVKTAPQYGTVNNITINNYGGFPQGQPVQPFYPQMQQVAPMEMAMRQPCHREFHPFEYNSTRSSSSSDCESEQPKPVVKRGDFKFPEGGWECSRCQNYNFKGRKECHRCKKVKNDQDSDGMPAHMQLSQNEKDEKKVCQDSLKKTVKKGEERVGDWTCTRCQNHNFAFREVCNKCQMSQADSAQMTAW